MIVTANAQLESEYQNIGAWKVSRPAREVRQESRDFWASTGPKGIRWLLERLRRERNIEVLDAAASLLADLGPVILEPVLFELDRAGVRDNGIALFGALSKPPPPLDAPAQTKLKSTLERYLRHPLLE